VRLFVDIEQITPDMLWFFGVFFITVAPVLRFRENFLVPMQAMLLSFGFYTQAFWMPDFFVIGDWLWIVIICILILICYFICGWIVHYIWGKHRLSTWMEKGALMPLLIAWLRGKTFIITDNYIIEIRRLRIFGLTWTQVAEIKAEVDNNGATLYFTDAIKREKEILSVFTITDKDTNFSQLNSLMYNNFPDIDQNWTNQQGEKILFSQPIEGS
jgi:hypothetical protein